MTDALNRNRQQKSVPQRQAHPLAKTQRQALARREPGQRSTNMRQPDGDHKASSDDQECIPTLSLTHLKRNHAGHNVKPKET
jgi:hypothetical protein